MTITTSTIILGSALFGAIVTLIGALFKVHNWYLQQEAQDQKIAENTKELGIICECLFATLDGLEQLGCNHSVPEAKSKMQNHINAKAHK